MRPSDKNSSKHCVLFPQLFAIYYAFAFLFLEKLRQFSIRNDKKMQQNTCCELAICIKANCVLHQNAAHLASKRSAFSTKTQCV